MRLWETVLLLVICGVGIPLPSANAQASGAIVTRTRLVTLFSDLQNQWYEAVKAKDASALDRLLGEDYEVWTPDSSGPIPREDWQQKAFARELTGFRIQNIAVRAVRDDVAVESFVVEETLLQNRRQITKRSFVVNLWSKDKNGWRCTDTYVSPVAAQPSPHSGLTTPSGKN